MSLGSSYQYLNEYRSVQDVVDTIMNTSKEDAQRLLDRKPFDRALYAHVEAELRFSRLR